MSCQFKKLLTHKIFSFLEHKIKLDDFIGFFFKNNFSEIFIRFK